MITAQTFHVDSEGFLSDYPIPRSERLRRGRYHPSDVIQVVGEGEMPDVPLAKNLLNGRGCHRFDAKSLAKGDIIEIRRVMEPIVASQAGGTPGSTSQYRDNADTVSMFGVIAARTEDRITIVSFASLKDARRSLEKAREDRSPAHGDLPRAEWADHALAFLDA